ncbi:GTPase-activating protein BEM3 [Aspergillus homomorphus CBS 101889]|uniref:RhoGAP-domain-containing protein n=1 Tax=Aspergillus homomorphus (strain CBS 101889) TaxID=1450537 RepID=A0A395HR17_ASPHC|nr:RhoGAP-domain-containing protein [Aspergillus homomorphus CBS 101889]RAL08694.1 RhoGAP-domain-containing protein [Aspergillus homomorphus CBS 101889]
MSQGRRQGSNNTHCNPFFANHPLSPASTTQCLAYPSSKNGLIPRDYLGPRFDTQTLPPDCASSPPPRKPIPSPAVPTSAQVQSAAQPKSPPSRCSLSPKSSGNVSPFQSASPSGHRAHATSPIRFDSGSRTFNLFEATASIVGPGSKQYDMDLNGESGDKRSHKGQGLFSRDMSITPPSMSPVNSLQSMSGKRQGQRTMPRTSSIDSAISSLSSTSQPNKSSFDANALSEADIGNLIATAGSAEAVIIHLLKEKHHAASQNSQLWRLVDKQRTLILGLNKDLERTTKEKERYRKKVKELQSMPPPLPNSTSEFVLSQRAVDVDSKFGQEQPKETGLENGGTLPNYEGLNLKEDNNRLDGPPATDSQDSFGPIEPPKQNINGSLATPGYQSSFNPRQVLSTTSPKSFTSTSSARSDFGPSGDKLQRVPQPIRKPPPAPLNLDQGDHIPVNNVEDSDSGSEYEDILAVDEFPAERGRRRTRDEDDVDREAIRVTDKDFLHGSLVKDAHSPRAAGPSSNQQQLPPINRAEPDHSSPLMARAGSLRAHPIITIPKSPGLPISPRPEDRPLGSPLPRLPREIPNSLISLPLSSESTLSGLALSPRNASHPNFSAADSTTTELNSAVHGLAPGESLIQHAPSGGGAVKIETPQSPSMRINGVYRGFISDDYPNLLLPPNALPLIHVKVSSSRLRPSRNSYLAPRPSEEEPVFTLGVFSRSDNKELWRVEKVIAALPLLDQHLRQVVHWRSRLPDRAIFSGHSPAKVDARRAVLDCYFETLLETPMDEKAALIVCQFLTSDAIEARDDEMSLLQGNSLAGIEIRRGPDGKPRKEGYLTKRGKNFGGWKARYFVLHGPELKYFESPGGPHLGTIRIHNAQIGKQSPNVTSQQASPSRVEEDSDNQYRHAFLILEPKKKDSSALVRHVLCAESDEERDAWVDVLLEYVEVQAEENEGSYGTSSKVQVPSGKLAMDAPTKSRLFPNANHKKQNRGFDHRDFEGLDVVQGFSYDDAVPAEPPVLGPPGDRQAPKSPLVFSGPPTDGQDYNQDYGQSASKVISGPTNGTVIQDAGAWGNKTATSVKEKKRSIWGFRTRSSMDLASQLQAAYDSPASQILSTLEKREIVRPVFGLPLAEAVQLCAPQGLDVGLPAVVYRCIEYLKAKGAELEEGIFRLSGSNVVVKALKERFNNEGDVDFLADDEYHDVHAVASLFKQYLRELPTTVLTRELHLDFLRVLELQEKKQRITAFNVLVHRLPKPNLALLRALVQFLMIIVNNSDINKMTIRNVGIVFAPTLNIPAPVFSTFLTDYEEIFDELPDFSDETIESHEDFASGSEAFRFTHRQVLPDPALFNHGRTVNQEQLGPPHDAYTHPECVSSFTKTSYETLTSNAGLEGSQSLQSNLPFVNTMLSPNVHNTRSAKAKRRESSLLFMDTNNHIFSPPVQDEPAA